MGFVDLGLDVRFILCYDFGELYALATLNFGCCLVFEFCGDVNLRCSVLRFWLL